MPPAGNFSPANSGIAEASLDMINTAIERDPLEPEFYFIKGEILRHDLTTENAKDALRCFSLASEIEPESWKYATAAAEMKD